MDTVETDVNRYGDRVGRKQFGWEDKEFCLEFVEFQVVMSHPTKNSQRCGTE